MTRPLKKARRLFRDAHGRGPGALLLGALLTGGLGLAAQRLTQELPPLAIWPGDHQTGILYVDAGENTFDIHGQMEKADLLIVGDSRVSTSVVPPRFEEQGLGEVALIWAGAARLGALARIVEEYPELPTVIAVSPLSFAPRVNPVIAELNRKIHPGFNLDLSPRAIEPWVTEETQHLLDKGFHPGSVKRVMVRAQRLHARLYEEKHNLTGSVDASLGRWLDVKRCEWVTPIQPEEFDQGWVDQPNAGMNDKQFAWSLRSELREEREMEADRVFRRLADIPRARKIAFVRLPTTQRLRQIEDRSVGARWLDRRIEALKRPYLDLGLVEGASPYTTHDGSHLDWPSAERASREISAWLRDELGWGSTE